MILYGGLCAVVSLWILERISIRFFRTSHGTIRMLAPAAFRFMEITCQQRDALQAEVEDLQARLASAHRHLNAIERNVLQADGSGDRKEERG